MDVENFKEEPCVKTLKQEDEVSLAQGEGKVVLETNKDKTATFFRFLNKILQIKGFYYVSEKVSVPRPVKEKSPVVYFKALKIEKRQNEEEKKEENESKKKEEEAKGQKEEEKDQQNKEKKNDQLVILKMKFKTVEEAEKFEKEFKDKIKNK